MATITEGGDAITATVAITNGVVLTTDLSFVERRSAFGGIFLRIH